MRNTTKILTFLPALLLSGCYVTVQPGAAGTYEVAQPQPMPVQVAPSAIVPPPYQPILPGVPAHARIVPQPAKIVPATPVPPPYRPILPGVPAHPQMVPQPAKIAPAMPVPPPYRPILPGQTQHPVPVIIKPADPCQDPKNPACHKPVSVVLG